MNYAGEVKRILLVLCILICVVVSSATAGAITNPEDDSFRIPVSNVTIATTTMLPLQEPLLISTPPLGMAPVNPAYLRYLQQQQQPPADERFSSIPSAAYETGTPVSSHPTGRIPPYEDLSHLKGIYVVEDDGISSPEKTLQKDALPAKYDLRALGRVPPVKDQGNHGACWAFATFASLESTLLPGEAWDFSENNMKNLLSDQYPDGFDRNYSKGGTHKMSTAYLTRWSGPVNQSDDPYNITSPYSPTNLTVQKHVQRVDFIPDRTSSTDNTNLKTAVKAYGAVYTSYNVSDEIPAYWNADTNSYYYFGPDSANHAVAIVGWDDGWSRYNFSTVPDRDGAFIIKNSWGATWGDSGFFYCSYNDTLMGKENALFISSPPTNYDHIYQYDPFGWVSSIYTSGEKVGFAANVFNSTRSQNLSAVSFYTTDTNADYQAWVYVNPNDGPVLNSSGAVFTQNGTFANAGYHTIAIPKEISLDAKDRFAVAVKLTNPTYNWSIAIQDKTYETSKARAYPGQGYTSEDGSTWTDVTTPADQKNVSLCIKAFTRDPALVVDFTGAPIRGVAPLTVRFTDNSVGNPTEWNWSFEDDSSLYATQQNPVHTYTSPGSYTVSLTVTNAHGKNTSTRSDYITVSEVPRNAPSRIGTYREGAYYLRDCNSSGVANRSFAFGDVHDVPVTGDWDGNGNDTIGVYRNGRFYLRDSNTAGDADLTFAYGQRNDTPVTGDWDGDGIETIGVYRDGAFYLRNNNTAGVADLAFTYGSRGDIPVTGDWDGDGIDTIGVFRDNRFYLRNSNTAGDADLTFAYGQPRDMPVTGDWDGDGIDTIGIYRDGVCYLKDSNSAGDADETFDYGEPGDIPVTGDWV